MSAPALTAVAGWDLPLLRGAVGTLHVVAGRVPAWRARVEAVGRALEAAECWSGPAAQAAGEAVVRLSTATTAVSEAFAGSSAALARLLGAAEEGQDAAAAALATAAAEGLPLDEQGRVIPDPAPAAPTPEQLAAAARQAEVAARIGGLAGQALEAAGAVGTAAVAADRALFPVGGLAAPSPARFADLLDLLPPDVEVPGVPAGPTPAAAAQWWGSLSEPEQRAVIDSEPARVGALDGVPAWARDRANRLLLGRALADPAAPAAETAGVVAAEIERQEAAGRQVQLWTLDLDHGRVAFGLGDLDTADAVALLVPGIFTTPEDDLPGQVTDAARVADRAAAAAPGLAVAAVAWLGYRTPDDPLSILTRGAARRGGPALDAALDGLAAARTALAAPDPRTTVVAHSYGTVVVDEAARADGRLAADAVVLLGSPGGAPSAAALEAPEVYDSAVSLLDPVSWVPWFGPIPSAPAFGASELPTDLDTLHWDYYDPDHPTLGAVGGVVAGSGHE